MTRDLSGRVALVTGASTGIGAATARRFVDAGARVVLHDINDEDGASLAAELGEDSALYQHVDLRDAAAIELGVRAAAEKWGRLDVVFSNAGAGLNAALVDHGVDAIDKLIAINLRSVVLVARAALPHLLENRHGGVIVNNASNGGVVGRAPDPVYVATKHGVVGFTKSLALAHAHQNIRVNAVCPGPIDTPMLWGNFEGVPREEAERAILATCPDPRIAAADEVAEAVLYLSSDLARFVNGVALPIDGAKAAGVMPPDRYRRDFALSSWSDAS